jgi:hypothetical protein
VRWASRGGACRAGVEGYKLATHRPFRVRQRHEIVVSGSEQGKAGQRGTVCIADRIRGRPGYRCRGGRGGGR